MRILITTWRFSPDFGGSERLSELLARGFAARGHEVQVITHSKARDIPDDFPFTVHRRPSPAAFRALCRWSDVNMFASIHLKWIGRALLAKRNVVVQHNYDYAAGEGFGNRKTAPLKYLLSYILPGIGVSSFLQKKTRSRDVILNPYDETLFFDETPWNTRTDDILFLGRLVGGKGTRILIDAVARLSQRGQKFRLTIIGTGPDADALKTQVERLDIGAQVHFSGALPPDQVSKVANRHRLVVVPSTQAEGFGLVATEALASGCAVIASNIGGLPDAVGPHGRLVPMGNSVALAEQIEEVLSYKETPPPEVSGVGSHLAKMHKDVVIERYLEVLASYTR